MQAFFKIAQVSFKQIMAYRVATIAGLATNFFFGVLRVAVLTALYGVQLEVGGISLQSAITFTGLTQAIIAFLSLFGWYDLMENISSGDIASDMLKPLSLFRYWMGRDLGRALGQLLLRGAPMMLLYALLFDITVPVGMFGWLSFTTSLGLAWLVSFTWRFLVNLAGFWVPNALGIGRMVFTISWFLSGFMMPLRFFPEWFQQLCYLTPFPQAVNAVVEIYLGLLEPHQVVQVLLGQVMWIMALWLASMVVMHFGIRKLVIQGG